MLDLRFPMSGTIDYPILIVLPMSVFSTATAFPTMPWLIAISTTVASTMPLTTSLLINIPHPFHVSLQFLNVSSLLAQEGHHFGKWVGVLVEAELHPGC